MVRAVGFVLLALWTSGPAQSDRETDDIREATYREMFRPSSKEDSMFCLSIYDKDPSDALMARFVGNSPTVRKGSECEPLETVPEAGKKPSPVAFATYYVDRPGDTKAEVLGAYFKNGLNAAESLFYLEKKDGKWTVVKVVQRWIA